MHSDIMDAMTGTPSSVATGETCEVRMIHPDRVDLARESLLDPEDAALLADRFKSLSDPGRLGIIYALLEAGEMCVCDLAAAVDASESATSHQLRHLRMAGLVRSRKEGRTVYYRIADTHVRLLLDVAVEHYLHNHSNTS
ncbi:MAG: metalloregulator ArsR/SmtB family transcription factor [Actinomycetota bacterium]|nr:metalloregulator ArsR/SmtB family transcription factor [Actinomycetota bacterium]